MLVTFPILAAPQQGAAPDRSGRACDRSVQSILRGNYDAALRHLEGARTSGASPAEVENLRGLALLLDGDTAKALESFNKAIALDASLPAARFNRALALLRRGEFDRAAAELETVYANENSPLRADAAYHLGIAYDRLKRPDAAEMWLDRAVVLDERLDSALLYLAMLRENRGDLQSAGRAYLQYLERHPQSPIALLRFGLAAHKSGNPETARTYLERTIAAAPRSAEALEARKFLVMWE